MSGRSLVGEIAGDGLGGPPGTERTAGRPADARPGAGAEHGRSSGLPREAAAADAADAASRAAPPIAATSPAFEARGLVFRYPGATRPALDGVDVLVPDGCLYAVLGPNGSGKSTLLRLLLGALTPQAGSALHAGVPIQTWPRRQLAARIGVVPQGEDLVFPLTVQELVALGRYPHLGPLGREGAADRRAVQEAMERCDVADLADRPVASLSGGERQRARLARALAQQPRTLVLDEPTAALDIRHEMQILEVAAELARDGVTVVLVTHALNLAARYATRLLLLGGGSEGSGRPLRGRVVAEGEPEEVITRERIEAVYGWPVAIARHPGPGPDAGAPQVLALATKQTPTERSGE